MLELVRILMIKCFLKTAELLMITATAFLMIWVAVNILLIPTAFLYLHHATVQKRLYKQILRFIL